MNILLFGEFSSLHNNLKKGLVKLGHTVTIASNGDGWKKIDNDLQLPSASGGLLSKIVYRIKFLKLMLGVKGYDVIQFINPTVIPAKFFPSKWIIKRLKKYNGKLFLVAAGSDSFYWTKSRNELRYGPFDDYIRYDKAGEKVKYLLPEYIDLNNFMAHFVDGIIPIMYEYEIAYEGFENRTNTIPIPVNLDEVDYVSPSQKDKIIVFHGLSRYGFKGTRHIEKAFKQLSMHYSEKAEFLIKGKMPIAQYLELLKTTDIVIDQTSSFSLGVNGIFALAMGKIVLGGAEPESLKALGITASPVINIEPNSEDIVTKVAKLIESRNLVEKSLESRQFAKRIHCCNKVANQYVDVWQRQ